MQEHPLYATTMNHYLSLLTLIGGTFLIAFSFRLLYLFVTKKKCPIAQYVDMVILPAGFLLTLIGTALSLFYSEVLRYAPCDLCWYQRVFLYPQVFLFAYAWYKKDKAVLPYVWILSFVGFVVAIYHHFLQIGYDLMKPCSTAPFAVDCSKPSFVEYGFVTFPLMAGVLFGFVLLFTLVSLRFKK